MDPINAADLLGAQSAIPLPAPAWFLILFKVLGFTLHVIPMGLWFAGLIVALIVHRLGGEHARRWSVRLFKQMPIIVALGINLGIVPLLFTQVAYPRVFYPATILMAVSWFSIIPLLIVAYYGVYIVASGLKRGEERLSRSRMLAGWIAALVFIMIGMLFASGMRMMVDLESWPEMWARTGVSGAVTGLAVNHGDPAMMARWLMMFGLSLMTVAVWVVFDAGVFGRGESDAYRQWAPGFAMKIYVIGGLWFALTASWYVFGTWEPEVRAHMFSGPRLIITVLTAASPVLPFAVLLMRRGAATMGTGLLIFVVQFAVVALNAVSRQIKQSFQLSPHMRVSDEPYVWQTSPLLIFLVLFVAGLALIGYMVARAVRESREIEAG